MNINGSNESIQQTIQVAASVASTIPLAPSAPTTNILPAQKPIQVVQPLKSQPLLVQQSQSPSPNVQISGIDMNRGGNQQQTATFVLTNVPSGTGAATNVSSTGSPLMQQNVNIMNINLAQQTAGTSGSSQITLAPGTVIQLADGRILMPQAAQTLYVQMPMASSVSNVRPMTLTQQQPLTMMSGGCQLVTSTQAPQHQQFLQPAPQQSIQIRRQVAPTAYGQLSLNAASSSLNQSAGSTRLPNGSISLGRTLAPAPVPLLPQTTFSPTVQSSGNRLSTTGNLLNFAVNQTRSSTSQLTPSPCQATQTTSQQQQQQEETTPQIVGNSPADVLRKVEFQIAQLTQLPTLSDHQSNMLKQLREIRTRIQTMIKPDVEQEKETAPPVSQPGPSAALAPTASQLMAQKKTSPGGSRGMSFTLRRELMTLLGKLNLLTKPALHEESVLVEFRLNTQRYQLRMTRAQKQDLELVLTKANQQRQEDILQLLQQEQLKALKSPLVPPHRPLIHRAAAQRSVTSAAQRLQSLQAVKKQEFLIQANRAAQQRTQGSGLPTPSSTLDQSAVPAPSASPLRMPAPRTYMPQIAVQTRRMAQLRRLLGADHKHVLKPPQNSPFHSVKDIMMGLLPYHVFQDNENTQENLRKADEVIRQSTRLILERKERVLSCVNAILTKESLAGSEGMDRLLIGRLGFDLDKAVLEEEQRQTEDAVIPLEFDEEGNAHAVELMMEDPMIEDQEDMLWESTGDVSTSKQSDMDLLNDAFDLPWDLDLPSDQPVHHSDDPDVDAAVRSIL